MYIGHILVRVIHVSPTETNIKNYPATKSSILLITSNRIFFHQCFEHKNINTNVYEKIIRNSGFPTTQLFLFFRIKLFILIIIIALVNMIFMNHLDGRIKDPTHYQTSIPISSN